MNIAANPTTSPWLPDHFSVMLWVSNILGDLLGDSLDLEKVHG